MIARLALVIAFVSGVACVRTEGPKKPKQEGDAAWLPDQKKFGTAIAVGQPAPSFDLASVSGRVSLDDVLSRERALIVFYRGDWCPFCRTQLEELQKYIGELDKRGVEVIAISVDPVATSAKLTTRLSLSFALGADTDHETLEAYGVYDSHHEIAWPAVFVVERDRKVSWRYLADDYKVRPTVEELLRALDETGTTTAAE